MEISVEGLPNKYKCNKLGLNNFNPELKNRILGPNGARKSTLMHTLATTSRPSEGHVNLNGIDIVKFTDTLRKVLLTFSVFNLGY